MHPLFRKKNVVARWTGSAPGRPKCCVVGVTKKLPLWRFAYQPWNLIPRVDAISRLPTDVVEVGKIKLLSSRTNRHDPVPLGISVGHKDITAGTVGFMARDNDPESDSFGLEGSVSNNHVYANVNVGEIGDEILQPGAHDGGTLNDTALRLKRFVEILVGEDPCAEQSGIFYYLCLFFCLFYGCDAEAPDNKVDAAFALPDGRTLSPRMFEAGTLTGIAEAVVGETIFKDGRSSGFIGNPVEAIDGEAAVDLGDGRRALFVDLIVVDPKILIPGDSGSPTFNQAKQLVGIGFAGSDQISLHVKIQNIIEELKVELVT